MKARLPAAERRSLSMRHRVGAIVAFGLCVTLAVFGLAAWGPLPIVPVTHRYADTRTWLGIPNGVNVLVNLPMFWLAVGGWCATHTSPWPRHLRRPWQCFHVCVMAAALSAAMYHAAPSDRLFLITHIGVAATFVMLSFGMLAELVDPRFGSLGACTGAALTVASTGAWLLLQSDSPNQGVDLRPLIWMELLPMLLIFASVPRLLAAQRARSAGWLVALGVYGSSKIFDWADAAIFQATGWISGHTLMHLAITGVVGWMAYRAATSADAGPGSTAESTQRRTSLNTLG